MPAPTSGLARITIRAPRRRLDLAIPHQVPLAELLPEVVVRAGESGGPLAAPVGGWVLRRGDGASLVGDAALAHQGVRDGDVLYLVPRSLTWPEPDYDDVVEEIAAGARAHGRAWDAGATRVLALAMAGLALVAGLVLLMLSPQRTIAGLVAASVAVVLVAAGALVSRALGDGPAGAAAGALGALYAAVAGVLLTPGGGTADVLVGGTGLALAAVIGGVAVGYGLAVFTAAVTVGIAAGAASVVSFPAGAAGAAAVAVVVLVAGMALVPMLAVRVGRLPLPVLSASPEALAAERRPDRASLHAAVARADEILAGCLLGVAVAALGCVAVLAGTAGVAGPLLAGLASGALVLRARLFPAVAARLPLLAAGLTGLALTAGLAFRAGLLSSTAAPVIAAGLVVIALGALVASATRRRGSPWLARAADLLDVAAVVSLAPVACAVLGLYGWVRDLAG